MLRRLARGRLLSILLFLLREGRLAWMVFLLMKRVLLLLLLLLRRRLRVCGIVMRRTW